nr:MAG TPA: hypothetical protein [Crassvirales sp.]
MLRFRLSCQHKEVTVKNFYFTLSLMSKSNSLLHEATKSILKLINQRLMMDKRMQKTERELQVSRLEKICRVRMFCKLQR